MAPWVLQDSGSLHCQQLMHISTPPMVQQDGACCSIFSMLIQLSRTSLLLHLTEAQIQMMTRYKAVSQSVCAIVRYVFVLYLALFEGENDPQYASVIGNAPISTWPVHSPKRWNLLLDALIVNDTITVPTSTVVGAPDNKAVVLMDSGSSYTFVLTFCFMSL